MNNGYSQADETLDGIIDYYEGQGFDVTVYHNADQWEKKGFKFNPIPDKDGNHDGGTLDGITLTNGGYNPDKEKSPCIGCECDGTCNKPNPNEKPQGHNPCENGGCGTNVNDADTSTSNTTDGAGCKKPPTCDSDTQTLNLSTCSCDDKPKKNWKLDKDNDGFGQQKSAIKSPGGDWVVGTVKGSDCDDTVHADINNNDCSKKPCKSADGKKANPLINMKILPTPGDISARNSKPVNGDFGGRGGNHNGVDLAAKPGTPIYAQYDGKITGNIVTSWPDNMGGLSWNEFRDNRKDSSLDSNSGGNRFRLEVEVDGQMYHIQYMHIQEGGVIHSRNTEVKAGDLIGYTGATGSVQATGSGGPHLHIEYWINGQYKNYADPKNFFQSNFDEFGNTTNPCE